MTQKSKFSRVATMLGLAVGLSATVASSALAECASFPAGWVAGVAVTDDGWMMIQLNHEGQFNTPSILSVDPSVSDARKTQLLSMMNVALLSGRSVLLCRENRGSSDPWGQTNNRLTQVEVK